MIRAFGQDSFVTHFFNFSREFIIVNQLGVSENLGLHAEKFLNFLAVFFDLPFKLIF